MSHEGYTKQFEDEVISTAKEVSKDWTEWFDEPMDWDDVEEIAKIFQSWLNYFQGNITYQELIEMGRG